MSWSGENTVGQKILKSPSKKTREIKKSKKFRENIEIFLQKLFFFPVKLHT